MVILKFENIIYCDKCHKKLKKNVEYNNIKWVEKLEILNGEEKEMVAEVCDDCLKEFKRWLAGW